MSAAPELDRRVFLARTGRYLALTLATSGGSFAQSDSSRDPFTLGVASGDPEPDGVVLWTRLAPDPLQGGGMPPHNVEVEWKVATDPRMASVVVRGRETATPGLAHSVHVEVRGLKPGRWYWYQFKAGSHLSPIGRTRTAPDPRRPLGSFRFAFASCQNYEAGFYTAYRHMADEDLDLVVHLGDYIYDSPTRTTAVRKHDGPKATTLSAYRNRYALYHMDPDLKRVHATFPWVVTWDDHEVENDYANDASENNTPRQAFLEQRAGAYQAYYEHMPVRRASMPKGSSALLYRRIAFSNLVEFSVLDGRQYRSDQPCGGLVVSDCAAAALSSQTMLGPEQERWFLDGLAKSTAKWNIVANQVMMMQLDSKVGPEVGLNMDKWDGYQDARARILKFIEQRRVSNPIVITGDIHSNWVGDLKLDWTNTKAPIIATEFIGTSISSAGDGTEITDRIRAYLPDNPHVHFYNGQRGYVRCEVTPDRWQADYRVVPYVSRPGAEIATLASFVVESGQPGAQKG